MHRFAYGHAASGTDPGGFPRSSDSAVYDMWLYFSLDLAFCNFSHICNCHPSPSESRPTCSSLQKFTGPSCDYHPVAFLFCISQKTSML